MRILVVNDDGIKAPGIKRLVQMAAGLGEVWVVAPAAQCSAMSHRITVRGDLEVKPYDFPATGVTAYSVGGTPADCVKVALGCLMTEKPDIVFSGINAGYNVGRDILYSGTIGAAMEALCWGVPAIAFSVAEKDECEVLNTYLEPVAKELISKTLPQNEIWNVNFPGCTLEEYKGILLYFFSGRAAGNGSGGWNGCGSSSFQLHIHRNNQKYDHIKKEKTGLFFSKRENIYQQN